MNKIINSKCACGHNLLNCKKEVIMLNPCEHLIHVTCRKELTECPVCDKRIKSISKLNDRKISKQKYADILSMTNYDDLSCFNFSLFYINLPDVCDILFNIAFSNNREDGKQLCKKILKLNNVKINVYGYEKIKDENKVFISNHTSQLDTLILFYLLNTGFLASTVLKQNVFGNKILKILPCLLVERGNKNNSTVDQMKKYIAQNGSICLFPEGMLTNPNTIIRFRTGAFHTDNPVYPIVIKYHNIISDSSDGKFIMKLTSSKNIKVSVHILDPYYPPFNENKIEEIRYEMCKTCDMLPSRVTNRDIDDKKYE